jgi:hypothetical protein
MTDPSDIEVALQQFQTAMRIYVTSSRHRKRGDKLQIAVRLFEQLTKDLNDLSTEDLFKFSVIQTEKILSLRTNEYDPESVSEAYIRAFVLMSQGERIRLSCLQQPPDDGVNYAK